MVDLRWDIARVPPTGHVLALSGYPLMLLRLVCCTGNV